MKGPSAARCFTARATMCATCKRKETRHFTGTKTAWLALHTLALNTRVEIVAIAKDNAMAPTTVLP